MDQSEIRSTQYVHAASHTYTSSLSANKKKSKKLPADSFANTQKAKRPSYYAVADWRVSFSVLEDLFYFHSPFYPPPTGFEEYGRGVIGFWRRRKIVVTHL